MTRFPAFLSPPRASVYVALCVALALLGCGEQSTVRLEITAAPSLTLDGIAITINGNRYDEALTDSLVLVVPDRWAGHPQRIEVEGLHLGAAVAAAAIVVTPIAGREVAAQITLVDASCDLICDIGDADCDGDAVVACELGGDGCPAWGMPAACPTSAPFCSRGACADTCSDECTAGATKCEGASGERTCGQSDSDTCLDWSTAVSCGGDEVCANDTCTAAFKLTVAKSGSGSGTVTSSPAGIVCGAACSASYVTGTMVTLTAAPDADATFAGWTGGGCSGMGTCVVTLGAAAEVTARFAGQCPQSTCTPEVLATEPATPFQFVIDDTHLYWDVDRKIARRPKAGGATEYFSAIQAPRAMVVDATHIYWTIVNNNPILGQLETWVMRRPKAGGAVETVTTDELWPESLAIDDTHVYWGRNPSPPTVSDPSTLVRVTKSGGDADGFFEGVAGSVAVDATHVYWSTGSEIKRRAKSGGNVETITTGQIRSALVLDATHIYWTTDDKVMRATKSLSTIEVIAAGQAGDMYGLAVDATHVYWTNYDDDHVLRRAKTGGDVEIVASAQNGALSVEVDDSYVYWVNGQARTVNRLSRCACNL